MRNDSQLGLKHVGDASMPCPPHFRSSTSRRGPQRGVKRNRKRDVVNTRQNTIKMCKVTSLLFPAGTLFFRQNSHRAVKLHRHKMSVYGLT